MSKLMILRLDRKEPTGVVANNGAGVLGKVKDAVSYRPARGPDAPRALAGPGRSTIRRAT